MFFKRRSFLALLFVALLAILLQIRGKQTDSPSRSLFGLDRITSAVYRPIVSSWDWTTKKVKGVFENYLFLVGLRKENAQLLEEVGHLRLMNLSLEERLKILEEDRRREGLTDAFGAKGVHASVMAYDPYSPSQTVWIDGGRAAGIRPDQPVIGAGGLVGRVLRVRPGMSLVLLLIDIHFAVDVVNVDTRGKGLVSGLGRELSLKPLPYLSQLEYFGLGRDFRDGDLLVTSGLNGLYPAGLPVGTVVTKGVPSLPAGERVGVVPAVDFAKLERVTVLTR